MSLLDDGPDAVTFYPEVETTDGDGNPVRTPGTGVVVHGRVQPLASSETGDGQQVATLYRFLCRSMPGGAFARAAWGGRTWDVTGEPTRQGGSEATRHDTVTLRARTAEPLA